MSKGRSSPTFPAPQTTQPTNNDEGKPHPSREIRRRSFLQGLGVTGAAVTLGTGIMTKGIPLFAEERSGSLTKGDAAILRFLAAAEIIESISGCSIRSSQELKTMKSPSWPAS